MTESTNPGEATAVLTIQYPAEVLWALEQQPDEFADAARLMLAVKLYETGKLSTGLAARFAGIPRSVFIFTLGRYGISPFSEDPAELQEDLTHALRASNSE